jgi:hypothetical protein
VPVITATVIQSHFVYCLIRIQNWICYYHYGNHIELQPLSD